MLHIKPRSLLSWDYTVFLDEIPLAKIDQHWFHERAEVTIGTTSWNLYREGMLGAFVLAINGQPIVRATKPSIFQRRFEITYKGRSYRLEAVSAFSRSFELGSDDELLGTIAPANPLTRRSLVDFSDHVPAVVQIFAIWLVILMWRRAAAPASN